MNPTRADRAGPLSCQGERCEGKDPCRPCPLTGAHGRSTVRTLSRPDPEHGSVSTVPEAERADIAAAIDPAAARGSSPQGRPDLVTSRSGGCFTSLVADVVTIATLRERRPVSDPGRSLHTFTFWSTRHAA